MVEGVVWGWAGGGDVEAKDGGGATRRGGGVVELDEGWGFGGGEEVW